MRGTKRIPLANVGNLIDGPLQGEARGVDRNHKYTAWTQCTDGKWHWVVYEAGRKVSEGVHEYRYTGTAVGLQPDFSYVNEVIRW